MDVAFGIVGQVEVDDVGDALDVDAARRDVGCHQGADVAGAKALEGPSPGVLGLVAVDGVGADAALVQVPGDPVGAVLGAGENEHPLDVLVFQQVAEQGAFLVLGHEKDPLFHLLGRRRRRGGLDAHRIVQQAAGQTLDRIRHGGREQHRLAAFGQGGGNLLHVADEAHVEHAVRFVEDKDLDRVEPQVALVHQVDQPPRGGGQDVDALGQGPDLGTDGGAAEDDACAQAQVAAVGSDAVADLARQFAGRRQDQRLRLAAIGFCGGLAAVFRQAMQQGQGESGGLAGAGLGDAQQVAPLNKRRDGFGLDGGGGGVAFVRDGAKDGLGQFEAQKISHVVLFFLVQIISDPPPRKRRGGRASTMQALPARPAHGQTRRMPMAETRRNETPTFAGKKGGRP